MSETIEALWAKSPRSGKTVGESLPAHTDSVVKVLPALIHLHPDLPDLLDCPRLWHRLYWACCFHDLGKAAAGFQRQVREAGWRWGQRHEVLSLAFLAWADLMEEDRPWIAAAVAAHHRDVDEITEKYDPRLAAEDDAVADMVQELDKGTLEILYDWISAWGNQSLIQHELQHHGVEPLSFRDRAAACDRGAMLAAAHDGLRCYRKLNHQLSRLPANGPAVLQGLALRGLIVMADHLGSAHAPPLRPIGFEGAETILTAVNKAEDDLYPHQAASRDAEGRTALLVAPTGSGKTEAALLWAASGARQNASRLFYLLPYQASINAMADRLRSIAPGRVGLQHGRSLHALYRQALLQEQNPARAAAIAHRERDLSRLLHPPIRVLTPYQLLKACFRLKGYEAILADVSGATFIIDEIHAYEARRLAMILGMARYLQKHYATNWYVMSATLPSLIREAIQDALSSPVEIAVPAELFARFRRHTLRVLDGDLEDEDNLKLIAANGSKGAVLVCVNTVRKAQRVHDALNSLVKDDVTVLLLHGAFNVRDRLDRERQVMTGAAAGAANAARRLILVATQVIEVSLDLSFDTIYSDPAPIDALVQRFGRINRRPGGQLCPVHVFRLPAGGQHVYDGEVVGRTVSLLAAHHGEPIDEQQLSLWLDEIYADSVAEAWRAQYASGLREFEAATLSSLRPFQSSDELAEKFYEAFDAVEVLPAVLEQEYDQLHEERPIEAGELLVSVRHYVLPGLKREGRLRRRPNEWLTVIDVPYTSDRGLRIRDG